MSLIGSSLLAVVLVAGTVRGADVEAGRRKSQTCAACHGADGNATIAGTPSLAGHPEFYTHWQLVFFQNEKRRDPQMSPMAANLSTDDMADLAAYYAAQTSRPRPGRPTGASAPEGPGPERVRGRDPAPGSGDRFPKRGRKPAAGLHAGGINGKKESSLCKSRSPHGMGT